MDEGVHSVLVDTQSIVGPAKIHIDEQEHLFDGDASRYELQRELVGVARFLI